MVSACKEERQGGRGGKGLDTEGNNSGNVHGKHLYF